MSLTANAAFSISQFREAWRQLCAASPDTDVASEDGLEFIFSQLPIAFFNVGIVTGDAISADALERYGRRALQYAASAHVPWLFIVTHDTLLPGVDAVAVLDACGLVPMLPLTGMIAHHLTAPSRSAGDLSIDLARDDESCMVAFDINAAAYDVSLDDAMPLYGKRAFWDPHVLSLGYVDGTAVASTAVMHVDGCRYVALVATRPDRQRRGYAEAVMRHALDASLSRFGDRPTTLHATDAGRPVYARMGYETIASHTAFIDKAFLEGH